MSEHPLFDALREEMRAQTKPTEGDIRLLYLFDRYAADIGPTFDGSFHRGSAIDWVGPTFHKAFRQADVVLDRSLSTKQQAAVDMTIWKLLGGGFSADQVTSDSFWTALEKLCSKVDEERAKTFGGEPA